MSEVQQNTLYLITPGSSVARDHLTVQVEAPVYPPDLPADRRTRKAATDWRTLSIPIHHLESVCVFGASTVSPPALELCWEHDGAVNLLSDHGHFQARLTGVADTSVTLRRAQFRAADDPAKCAAIARQVAAGKLQNARNRLLRAGRETDPDGERTAGSGRLRSLGCQRSVTSDAKASPAMMGCFNACAMDAGSQQLKSVSLLRRHAGAFVDPRDIPGRLARPGQTGLQRSGIAPLLDFGVAVGKRQAGRAVVVRGRQVCPVGKAIHQHEEVPVIDVFRGALLLALDKAGKSILARMAIMAITTSNPISVKAPRADLVVRVFMARSSIHSQQSDRR